MLIRTIVVTPFMQNARVIVDEKSREACVIDPGGDIRRILPLLDLDGEPLNVSQIFLTHAHIDHAGGVQALQRALVASGRDRARLLAHRNEQELRAHVAASAGFFGLSPAEYEDVPEPDGYIEAGDALKVGSLVARALFTPGHSPGHLSLFYPSVDALLQGGEGEEPFRGPLLIAGDVLFQGTIGRTDLPGGDMATLLRSVREQIFVLPDETRILCGHGGDTTVGDEKRTNPFFQ